jgi:hypothetical protein
VSYYDPFQEHDDAMDKAMKVLMAIIVCILLIGSCKAHAVEATPSLIEGEMASARAVIIYQRIKLGMSARSANESVLKKCGWMRPEHVIDIINTKMTPPASAFELASDVGVVMELACEDPST